MLRPYHILTTAGGRSEIVYVNNFCYSQQFWKANQQMMSDQGFRIKTRSPWQAMKKRALCVFIWRTLFTLWGNIQLALPSKTLTVYVLACIQQYNEPPLFWHYCLKSYLGLKR